MYPHDVEAEITYWSTEEGGRKSAVRSGYRSQIHCDGYDWDAVHVYPDVDVVYPGQTARVWLSFLSPDAHVGKLYPGKQFQIREGRQIFACGTVTKILQLEESAARIKSTFEGEMTQMQKIHKIPLQQNGPDQVLTIPPEFALWGTEVTLRKEGHRLIVEPLALGSLLSLLTRLEDISEDFPDVDEGSLPLDDIAF